MFGLGPIELGIIFLLFTVFPLVLLIWALIDLLQNPYLRDVERLIWAIVVIFVGCIGPILYLAIGRNIPPPGSRTDV